MSYKMNAKDFDKSMMEMYRNSEQFNKEKLNMMIIYLEDKIKFFQDTIKDFPELQKMNSNNKIVKSSQGLFNLVQDSIKNYQRLLISLQEFKIKNSEKIINYFILLNVINFIKINNYQQNNINC